MRKLFATGIMLFAAACAAPAEEPGARLPAPADTTPAEPPATAVVLPANTYLAVELQTPLSVAGSRLGQTFTVRVVEPLIARNRATVVPTGATITGMVTGVQPGADTAEPLLRLNFLRIDLEGVMHPLSAHIVTVGDGAEPATADVRVVRGEEALAAIINTLGRGAGSILVLGAEPALPAGTRMTIRTMDTIQLR